MEESELGREYNVKPSGPPQIWELSPAHFILQRLSVAGRESACRLRPQKHSLAYSVAKY